MTKQNDIKILDQIVAVNLNVNIWSAKTKLHPEDFKHADLPPGNLASLGSKKVCNPKQLRIFGTLKSRAVSLLDKHGIRFLGGWAIPEKLSKEIANDLNQIAQEFETAKKQFLKEYDQSVQDWIKQNPGWEQIIANSIVSKNYVSGKIGFNYQLFCVVHTQGSDNDTTKSGLSSALDLLPETLLDDVAKTAKDAYKRSYEGKTEVTRKALAPLKNILQKLHDLSFIEPNVVPIATLIGTALNRIPLRGAISGDLLAMLKGIVQLISDKTLLSHTAGNLKKGALDYDGVLDSFIQTEDKKKRAEAKTPENIHRAVEIEPEPQEEVKTMQLDSMGLW
jgi:hypothetical protein